MAFSQDNAVDALLDQRHVEVDQIAQAFSSELQLRQKLGAKQSLVAFDSLQLTHNQVLNKHIQSQRILEHDAIVLDGQLDLSLDLKAALRQLVAETDSVHMLEETWAKFLMHMEGGVYHNAPNTFLL